MKKDETAMAKTKAGTVSTAVDYGADAGKGFENQTRDDISIPFLVVLQSNSPQVTDSEKARPGMLFNTITEELFSGKDGRIFVPATTAHAYVEWKPRDSGGGFVGMHKPESDTVKTARAASKDFGKYKLANGNELVETFYIYGMMLDAEDQPAEMVVIGFTSTKISVYKRWNTKVNMFTLPGTNGAKIRPPLFAHKVRISTVKEKNNKGEFFNFDLQPADDSVAESLLAPGHPALEAAKGLRDMVASGLATAAHDTAAPAEEAAAPAAGGADNDGWNK